MLSPPTRAPFQMATAALCMAPDELRVVLSDNTTLFLRQPSALVILSHLSAISYSQHWSNEPTE